MTDPRDLSSGTHPCLQRVIDLLETFGLAAPRVDGDPTVRMKSPLESPPKTLLKQERGGSIGEEEVDTDQRLTLRGDVVERLESTSVILAHALCLVGAPSNECARGVDHRRSDLHSAEVGVREQSMIGPGERPGP